jgi:predicted flap endonuclease-1-like 5' DNA nuclease
LGSIDEVEGIGPAYAGKLAAAGVKTTDDLLAAGAKPSGRTSLAGSTGIDPALILEWVNHADLMRIKGVGSEYSDLLEAAGVDSPAELAQRNAANLAITFQEVVAARPGIVRRVPSESEVAGWIDQSKGLDKVVEH